MQTTANQSSVVHSTFSIERTYPSTPARVFAAFANPVTKRRWFAEGEGWEVDEFTVDFRVGGREVARFRFKGGAPSKDVTYPPAHRYKYRITGSGWLKLCRRSIQPTPS